MFTIKSKICPPSPPFHPFSKVLGASALLRSWFQCSLLKKCSEVSSGLRRLQMDPGWHWLWKRGWCIVWGLKLTIIGTWKFVTKAIHCTYILFARLNCNHIFVNYKRTKQRSIIHTKFVYKLVTLVLSFLKKNQSYYFRNFYLWNDHLIFSGWVCFYACKIKCPQIL